MQEVIVTSFLISAYDLYHSIVDYPSTPFSEIAFLDSGGYEASKDAGLAEDSYPKTSRKEWKLGYYKDVLDSWPKFLPTIAVSYDHPHERRPLHNQIDDALRLFDEFPSFGKEFLIKPESETQQYIKVPTVVADVKRFEKFDIIGLAEKELGNSVLQRMVAISRLRKAMDMAGINKPIHIFGSLEPVSTPLYFLAGADIFDGLSWLRFSYYKGLTVYHQDHGILKYGVDELERKAIARTYASNIYCLRDLQNEMHMYLLDHDLKHFTYHQDKIRQALNLLHVKLKEVRSWEDQEEDGSTGTKLTI